MAQIITFSVSEDGKISPSTVQKAGVQGNHNITEVRFNVEEALVSGALEDSPTSRIRMQFIDGAGGFYSTGFLDVMSEILPDESAQYYVTCPIPNNVTNAGGIAKVYLVITEIAYGVEDGLAYEDQVFISSEARISFEGSGIGSPSEYQYRQGISSALVNAEIFVGRAEGYANESLGYSNTAGEYAGNAADSAADAAYFANNAVASAENAATSKKNAAESATSAKKSEESANRDAVSANIAASVAQSRAEEAANSLQELKDGIANGDFKGEKGDKGEPGETPSLDGVIQYWQPNTEYKIGDVCLAGCMVDDWPVHAICACIEEHTSDYDNAPTNFEQKVWNKVYVSAGQSYEDVLGNVIHTTYATKEELEEALENIPTGEGGTITVDQTYNPTSENAQSGKAVAEAVKGITYEKITLIGGTKEDWSVAEFMPKSGHKYDLVIEPFTIRTWLNGGYTIYKITEHYKDGTSNVINDTPKSYFNDVITYRQRVSVDNSLGNIAKVEVKLRPETNTEAYVLFGDLENLLVTDRKRLDDTETDVNAVSHYFVYDKLTADFTNSTLNSTYVDVGIMSLNKPIHKGDKVTFEINAPSNDENTHYFNWYNGGTRLTGIANQAGKGSRIFEYTHNHEQDITAFRFVLVKVIQQNAYTITIYDENSIIKKVDDLSKSVDDISSGAVQVPDYYKDHLSGAISRAKTNLLNAGVEGETFVFISDLHWESNAKNSPALIGAITNELPIENVIFGGDAFNGGAYEDKVANMNDIRKQFEKVSKRFLSIYGNHDSNWLDGGTGFSNREFYTLLQKQSDYYAVHHDPSCYYYFYMDNPTTKTRMIFLDSGQTNPNYPSDEMAWLQSTVSSAPSGYNILVFSHIIFVPKSGGSYTDPSTWEMTTFMTSVCEYLDSVTDKNVKAIFGGHSHYDYVSKTTGGIPIVLIDCDARQTGTGNNQTLGSVNEQAFDIVTVNYKTNTVHCTRVGRGTDRTIEKQ